MIDDLLLLSGNDIPFLDAGLIIHQPRIREIAYITQQSFWSACELLRFNKDFLSEQDKSGLFNRTNFNIIMTIIQEKSLQAQKIKVSILSLLVLLFPNRQISLGKKVIQLRNQQTGEINEINENNFDSFQQILISMFCLTNEKNKQYNPSGELAKKIADKIKKGQEKRAKLSPDLKISILNRYISILAVAQKKDINQLMNYTVYQLMDEYHRFELKSQYDYWEKVCLAGGHMEAPENWMIDIHQDKK